jgi:hypothetical protein
MMPKEEIWAYMNLWDPLINFYLFYNRIGQNRDLRAGSSQCKYPKN